MDWSNPIIVLSGILSLVNAAVLIIAALKKLKPEVKKLENETEMQEAEVAQLNLKSAEISTQMLIDRVNELKAELDQERTTRKRELEEQRLAMQVKLDAEIEARRKETEYLRRRIKEADREARDYRLWAAKLVKQVVESGKVPHPFVPTSLEDSDPSIAAIGGELKDKNAEITAAWEERKQNDRK